MYSNGNQLFRHKIPFFRIIPIVKTYQFIRIGIILSDLFYPRPISLIFLDRKGYGPTIVLDIVEHSLIRGVLMQSCSAGAKNFTNYLFCHNCHNSVVLSKILKIINFIESKIQFSKFCSFGATIFNILDNTTALWMTKYIPNW